MAVAGKLVSNHMKLSVCKLLDVDGSVWRFGQEVPHILRRGMLPCHWSVFFASKSRGIRNMTIVLWRPPGRPRKCRVEQVTTSTGLPSSDAWSVATDRSAWRALRRSSVERERERERERFTLYRNMCIPSSIQHKTRSIQCIRCGLLQLTIP